MTKSSQFGKLAFFLVAILFIITCDNNSDPFSIDYSLAPPLPDTTQAISTIKKDSGLIIYVMSEGDAESDTTTIRDDIFAYYTVRLTSGTIISSSFANGNTSPNSITEIGAQANIRYRGDGFVEGVVGMRENERRILVMPPEINTTSETLITDIEVAAIQY